MPHQLIIPTGTRFGRLTVLGPSPQIVRQMRTWGCRCDCGMFVLAPGSLLTRGRLGSCGCLMRDSARIHLITHGKRKTPEYESWMGMRRRCRSPKNPFYHRYGGRGITICPEWDDFAVFLRDMGPRPSPGYSLDRIDNDGPYSPENCRWATAATQVNNRSTTRIISWRGERKSLSEWSRAVGIPTPTLHRRLSAGWPVERALTETPRAMRRKAHI